MPAAKFKSETLGQDNRHEIFKSHQNNCPLCGSQLNINTETYLEDYNIKEIAECQNCQLNVRVKDHKIH